MNEANEKMTLEGLFGLAFISQPWDYLIELPQKNHQKESSNDSTVDHLNSSVVRLRLPRHIGELDFPRPSILISGESLSEDVMYKMTEGHARYGQFNTVPIFIISVETAVYFYYTCMQLIYQKHTTGTEVPLSPSPWSAEQAVQDFMAYLRDETPAQTPGVKNLLPSYLRTAQECLGQKYHIAPYAAGEVEMTALCGRHAQQWTFTANKLAAPMCIRCMRAFNRDHC